MTKDMASEMEERAAFEARYKHCDLTKGRGLWGDTVYIHSHVEALWEGWNGRAIECRASAARLREVLSKRASMATVNEAADQWHVQINCASLADCLAIENELRAACRGEIVAAALTPSALSGDAGEGRKAVEPFEREGRYIVIKRSHLQPSQWNGLRALLDTHHINPVDAVVVEADWPEYEPVWGMIEARVTGGAK